MENKLIEAPIDEKNIVSDWIEELFDEQSALYGKNKYVGFMAGAVMQASWSGNFLWWQVLNGNRKLAFEKLEERNNERYPEDESPFVIKKSTSEDVQTWMFYWKPE